MTDGDVGFTLDPHLLSFAAMSINLLPEAVRSPSSWPRKQQTRWNWPAASVCVMVGSPNRHTVASATGCPLASVTDPCRTDGVFGPVVGANDFVSKSTV